MTAMAWAVHVNDKSHPNNTITIPVIPLHLVKVMVKENFDLLTPKTKVIVFLNDPSLVNKVHICTLTTTRKWAIVNLRVHPEEVVFGVEISGGLLGNHLPSEIGIVVSGTYEYSQDIQVMTRKYTAWKDALSEVKVLKQRIFEMEKYAMMKEEEIANGNKLFELMVESLDGRDDIIELYRVQLADKTRALELMEKKDEEKNEKKDTDNIAEGGTTENLCTLEVIKKIIEIIEYSSKSLNQDLHQEDVDGNGEKDEGESGEKDGRENGVEVGGENKEKNGGKKKKEYTKNIAVVEMTENMCTLEVIEKKDGDGCGEKGKGESGYEEDDEMIISNWGLEVMLAEQMLDEKVNEKMKVLEKKKGDTKK